MIFFESSLPIAHLAYVLHGFCKMRNLLYVLGCLFYLDLTKAQLSTLPTCARTCYTSTVSSTDCSSTDYSCLCLSSTFQKSYTCCVRSECDAIDDDTIESEAFVLCVEYGISITSLPASACSSSTSTATGTNTANQASTTTNSYTDSSDSSSDLLDNALESSKKRKSRLSTGGKAGIGVGVGSAAVIILGAIAWFIKRQRRKKAPGPSYETAIQPQADAAPEKPYMSETVSPAPPSEMQPNGQPVYQPDLSTPVDVYQKPFGPYEPTTGSTTEQHANSQSVYPPTINTASDLQPNPQGVYQPTMSPPSAYQPAATSAAELHSNSQGVYPPPTGTPSELPCNAPYSQQQPGYSQHELPGNSHQTRYELQ
ncbi:hypothetical protein P175DRAFT_0501895 [Aspergillus ochraceoroseus IBT 24754]|uniref:CFEM domain-containing protein n=1 Tax=Aspergillus ochraceoroseus IBT 24754 TaxID=1392256 RepID=A0A2T5LYD4_9EURO|nr:uncharacterized protein P175DRAFT_0501895 [Aspergillus ochraceoroseus IBT 24754]PTU21263.1 hypothetical protein P175DRAFT_0501895 [Aspergillus ochraceoroseus IBT 24754]